MSKVAAWVMALGLGTLMLGVPFVYYRYSYTYGKRLRPVDEGKVYRSGWMTAAGFADAFERYHFRTVLNLMEEMPDPVLSAGYFDTTGVREAELCAKYGARMVNLTVDLVYPSLVGKERPAAIGTFLSIMDDPASYPVLIHCRAGLHRTGVICALYRMEYDGWTAQEAMGELRSHGFGEFAATAANDYITQYILTYQPRVRFSGRPVPGRLMALPKGTPNPHP